jgi:hypothetical protein
MINLFGPDVLWIAQRHGQDWRDETVLAAIDWLTSQVPSGEWEAREAAVEARFQAAKTEWAAGRRIPLHDPADAVAWYVHQARRYADPGLRPDFFLPEGYRIAPLFRRIGQLLPSLRSVGQADERAARLMTENTAQPDDGIYELLVAGAYACRGWPEVEFVSEAPGIKKRPDLYVDRPRSHWAIECKRAGRSGYARDERIAGERMAARVHASSESTGHSLVQLVTFQEELHLLPENYLAEKVERFLDDDEPFEWADEGGDGVVFDAPWGALHGVLAHDDIYFGSSRMLELLIGAYDPAIDFSMGGSWTPAEGRPLHATWVDRVSLVVWTSRSEEAARRKAMHFRSLVARASEQLPGDRRGAIHVGYEAVGGNSADARRHHLNRREMRTFDPEETGLRIVYGNYFTPELVTARNESSAVTETTAWYPVGTGRILEPLPNHMVFKDEDGLPGSHLR